MVVMVMMFVFFMLMMMVMPAAALGIVVMVMMMFVFFMLMMMVVPAAAIGIVVMMVMMFVLMVVPAAAIGIMVVMVMMFVLMLMVMMVMSAGLAPVSVVHRDIRFIRLRDCFNRLFQTFRLLCLDTQLLGLKYHDSLLHLRQLANLRLNLACTVCTAKIFHNIDFICHANPSCPYPTEYAVFKSEHMNTCSYVFYVLIIACFPCMSIDPHIFPHPNVEKFLKLFQIPSCVSIICGIINTVIQCVR